MEDSRTNITLAANVFTNIYTALSTIVGTKLAIQNQSSDPVVVCIAASAAENKGFVVEVGQYVTIPAGSSGCFVKTVTNESGVVSVQLGGWEIPNAPIDERVYTGLKAFVVQNFIEANVKNSTQWEFATQNNSLAAGTFQDAVLIVGAQPILIKSRQIVFTGAAITAQVFEAPTYTGGTTQPIYNLNRTNPLACLSVMKTGVTTTVTGSQVAAPTYAYGTESQGNRAVGTFSVTGLERVLAPNTTYLLRITNNDTATAKVSTYVTFYEGEISSLN